MRVGFTQWGSETSTDSNYRSNYQWTYNINTNGTFHCPVALPQTKNSSDNTTSSDFIPYNWVIDTEIPEPTLTSHGAGAGHGSETTCSGLPYHNWTIRMKTTGVEGVTYYLNWTNANNATTFPADPTTTTYDVTATYSGQIGCVEADSECKYTVTLCDADMVGVYANFKVIGVRNGYVSSVSTLSIENPNPIQ